MKTPGLSRIFHPLYVLLAGAMGGVIVVFMFVQNYPGPDDPVGELFVHTPSYWVWIFLFFVLTSLVTIFFLPSWGIFVWMFRNYAPTHFAILETSRKLRDHLSPMSSLSTVKDTVEKRRLLDDLLQTIVGITKNLRAGIATLSPLVTSLIISVLGINI